MTTHANQTILLVGGGTGGHILPMLPLARELRTRGASVHLVLANTPLDRAIATQNDEGFPITFLWCGKLYRYATWRFVPAFCSVLAGLVQAFWLLIRLRPHSVFFKGGYVGVPVLIVLRLFFRRIPIFVHESDASGGLLTRMACKYAVKTFESFGDDPHPLFYVPPESDTTPPLPSSEEKAPKTLLVLGGSQGAQFLNDLALEIAGKMGNEWHIILVSGRGKMPEDAPKNVSVYDMLPARELWGIVRRCDIVLTRGGSNSLFEIFAAHKPAIVIPLPGAAQDHQSANARYFEAQNLCRVFPQSDATTTQVLSVMTQIMQDETMHTSLMQKNIHPHVRGVAEAIIHRQ